MRTQLQPKPDLFDEMVDRMGSIMESITEEMKGRNYFRSSGRDSWDPPMNVYETPDRFIVCVDLAGMPSEQIDVHVDRRTLHIRGLRPKPDVPARPEEISVRLMEIDSGKFHRQVALSADVAVESVQASYRNGYVWIVLPRLAER